MLKKIFIAFFTLLQVYTFAQSAHVGAGKTIDPYRLHIIKDSVFNEAAVVSAHPLASEVGALILKQGGNAFDAAIATQLALAVVYPQAGNLGGGGFLTARKNNGKIVTIDYREVAPAKAHKDMYLDSAGKPVGRLSVDGHLASGIPGTVAGLFETLKHGKLGIAPLIDPAISLAKKGFVLTGKEANLLNSIQYTLKNNNSRPNAFMKKHWKAGDTLVQHDLAQTLIRIKQQGQQGFYEGETARLIVDEMSRGNGIITLQDLKNYTAINRKPLKFTYRGYELISFPPPSSGGLLIAQMLKMTEPYNLKKYGANSAEAIHLMAEAQRRAYADRATYMGDPDFYEVPVNNLLDSNYLKKRMLDFDTAKATKSSQVHAGNMHESEQTTHISLADKEGNIVSVTTTLNNIYGSKTVIGGAGFFMNDEMDDFSIKPGVPNIYGAIGGEANAIAPGKRMLSSMAPTLILKNHTPFMVIGTPGGTTIPNSIFENIVSVIDFGMTASEAVKTPRFHHQWLPDTLQVEAGLPVKTVQALKNKGHQINKRSQIGRVEIILFDKNGKLQAAADTRGDDSAAGY